MLNPIEFTFNALKAAPVKRLLNEQTAQVMDRDLAASAGLPMTYQYNLLKIIIEAHNYGAEK